MDESTIIVLGSGTSHPLADRGSPAVLLRSGRELTLLDMGPGTMRQLVRAGVCHADLDRILITHFHPDHTAGLIHFLFATRHPSVLSSRKPFLIAGPSGTRALLSGFAAAYGRWVELPSSILHILEWPLESDQETTLGPLHIRTARVRHTERSLAYRMVTPDRRIIVYSGDTGFCDELIALAKGCDLLILECSFPDHLAVDGHLTPRLAGELAAAAEATKLLLIHFYPEVMAVNLTRDVRAAFRGELVIGRDFLVVRA